MKSMLKNLVIATSPAVVGGALVGGIACAEVVADSQPATNPARAPTSQPASQPATAPEAPTFHINGINGWRG